MTSNKLDVANCNKLKVVWSFLAFSRLKVIREYKPQAAFLILYKKLLFSPNFQDIPYSVQFYAILLNVLPYVYLVRLLCLHKLDFER